MIKLINYINHELNENINVISVHFVGLAKCFQTRNKCEYKLIEKLR